MLNNKRSVLDRRDHPAVIKRYDSWNPSPLPQEVRSIISLISSTSSVTSGASNTATSLLPSIATELNLGRIPFRIALRIRKHGPNRLGRGGNFNFDVKDLFVTAARISAATTETAKASPMTLTTEDLNGVSPHRGAGVDP